MEHIVEPNNPGWEGFWLMWYGSTGRPNIKESAVVDTANLQTLVAWLGDFSKML